MNEYIDRKQRRHKVIQTVRKYDKTQEPAENREAAAAEIVEALCRIFQRKETEKQQ